MEDKLINVYKMFEDPFYLTLQRRINTSTTTTNYAKYKISSANNMVC
jgi:hypothetical protein